MKDPEATIADNKDPESQQEDSFLRRWSQRKLDASNGKDEREKQTKQLTPDDTQSEINNNHPVTDPQLELSDEDMPPLETLDENSDYSGFFSPKVSESLRRQALRKLFHFQSFNITDGLNDYDDDYTHFEKLGNVVTQEMKRLLDSQTENTNADTQLDQVAANDAMSATGNEEIFEEESTVEDKKTTEAKVMDS